MSLLKQLDRLTGDDFSTTPVPMTDRLPTIVPLITWTGFAMFLPTYLVGAEIGLNTGSMGKAFMIIIAGTLFLALYLAMHGYIGVITGYSFGMLSAFSFGRKGAFIPAFNFGDAGWAVVIIGIFAWITGETFGVDPRIIALGAGLLMLTATFIGLKGAFWINLVQLIIMIGVGVFGTILALNHANIGVGEIFAMEFSDNINWAIGITMVVGLFANGASRGADLIRWCKRPKDAFKVGILAFGIGAMFCSLTGALIAASTGMVNIYDALVYLGLPIGAMLILFCLSWTTTDMSGYASSLGMSCIPKLVLNKDVPRRKVAMILSGVIVILAATGVHQYLEQWLLAMGTLLPAMGGIIFADFFIMSKTKYHWIEKDCYTKYKVDDPKIANRHFNWLVLPGLVIGGGFGYYTAMVSNWGIPSINSIVLSMILYVIACVINGMIRENKNKASKETTETTVNM